MNRVTVIVLVLAAWTSGYLIKVPIAPILQPTLAPSGWVHVQKLILPLFENVCEESTNPVICKLSLEFPSSLSAGDFWDPEVLSKFQTLKSGKGFLPKGQIFSEYNVVHTNELEIMFEVMRNAKTFDTFYKIAAWARQNLNCGLYVNLIYLALESRNDTEKLTLPPPYELLPNYFIRKDIIIQGSSLLAGEEFTPSEGVRDEGNAYTLDANYTANFYDNDDESKLAYFREDIGLNSYYFLRMLKWAPWLNKNVDINSRYGEEMYHMMKQLVARYNLERYCNGMPEQDNLNWDSLSDAPYDPMLVYSNGNEFIHRASSVQLPENEDKALLQIIETNIATVVSHMRETGYNKTQILNHLMEILVTGERSYDTLARRLLGKALGNDSQPSVFEHYMTSLRDPMIWKLYKKVVDLIDNSLKILPPYTKSELYFPGVEVINIDVKKIMTNFDYFEFDITEALKIGNGDTTFQVKIGQPRLNHKPFSVKLNISSLVTQKGLVKIYLGPKMMPGEFAKKKNMFNLLDCFEINLKKGSNIVTRNSDDMKIFSPDFISLKTLRKKVENAEFGLDSLPLNAIDSQINFPARLIIPKGTPEGLPLQLFVFVAPYMKATVGGTYFASNMEFNPAVLSPLYPLDLAVEDRILLDLPNALVKDISVTHKGVNKVSNYGGSGATKSWYDNSNGSPSKPNMYNNENEPFNYNPRNGQSEQNDVSLATDGQYYENQNVNYYDEAQNDGRKTSGLKQSFLKPSEYGYTSKYKQPYDYKSNRPQYPKYDYASKKVDNQTLYKDKPEQQPVSTDILNKLSENISGNKTPNSFYDDPDPTNRNYYDVDNNQENNQSESDDHILGVKHYLLKSSGLDNTPRLKENNDETPKRPKFIKPDYKKAYKNGWKTTEAPILKNKFSIESILNTGKTKNEEMDSMPLINDNDLVFEDESNFNVPSNKYDKMIYEYIPQENNVDYFRVSKDNVNEEFVKEVPVTKFPIPNLYTKYIMRVVHNDINNDIN